MSELPECLKTIKTRIRSIFTFGSARRDKYEVSSSMESIERAAGGDIESNTLPEVPVSSSVDKRLNYKANKKKGISAFFNFWSNRQKPCANGERMEDLSPGEPCSTRASYESTSDPFSDACKVDRSVEQTVSGENARVRYDQCRVETRDEREKQVTDRSQDPSIHMSCVRQQHGSEPETRASANENAVFKNGQLKGNFGDVNVNSTRKTFIMDPKRIIPVRKYNEEQAVDKKTDSKSGSIDNLTFRKSVNDPSDARFPTRLAGPPQSVKQLLDRNSKKSAFSENGNKQERTKTVTSSWPNSSQTPPRKLSGLKRVVEPALGQAKAGSLKRKTQINRESPGVSVSPTGRVMVVKTHPKQVPSDKKLSVGAEVEKDKSHIANKANADAKRREDKTTKTNENLTEGKSGTKNHEDNHPFLNGSSADPPKSKLPLPWDKLPRNPNEVFVFTGDNKPASQPATIPKSPLTMNPVVTTNSSVQCELDIYSCSCVNSSYGNKACLLCNDLMVTVRDKVLMAKNINISASTKHEKFGITSTVTENVKREISSSSTQTLLIYSISKISTALPVGVLRVWRYEKENLTESTIAAADAPLQITTGPIQAKEASKSVARDVSTVFYQTTESRDVIDVVETESPRVNKLDKIKKIWKHIKGSNKKDSPETINETSLLPEVPADTEHAPDPMAEMFLAATAEDLDRIDGITREIKRLELGEKDEPTESAQLNQHPNIDGRSNDAVAKEMGDKVSTNDAGNISKQIKLSKQSHQRHHQNVKDIVPHEDCVLTPVCTSPIIKRSRSLETLDLSAHRPRVKPFVDERVTFEYENPFEISGCIRIDGGYDPGQKAGRGHIPEIKVKQKRRGEPNKHLNVFQRADECQIGGDSVVNEPLLVNTGEDNEFSLLSNKEDAEEMSVEEKRESKPSVKDATDTQPAENEKAEDIVPDMRHCEKIPLEVIYGKKGADEEEDDRYFTRSGKKKKGRQRGRDRENRSKPPPLLGMKFDI